MAGIGAALERPTPDTKRNVLGVLVDAVDYDVAVEQVLAAARDRRPYCMTALAVHGVMTGVTDPRHRARLNGFDLVTPDGQPVRWALNLLHGAGLREWVSGPELVLQLLPRMAAEDLPIYLYGSTPGTLHDLTAALRQRVPGLSVAGAEASRFRSAGEDELRQIADRIRSSGARAVLVALGCPRQEIFAYAMRSYLDLPLLAVGAAFDFHAGRMRRAPEWMRRRGLSWLWRLALEPRRLWRRYLLLNPAYLAALAAQALGIWRPDPAPRGHPAAPEIVPV
ncbi:WecB/TagA/CpsF family glycosyltransferase [Asanoa iriomotensis]|uniref:UDP-N-acetyl-D-mannosaminuronic acid transferase n=1 Tax=Asanoa iriomotensis TaxID=234613 RepID=A0ABQ4BZ88_9ACTN|nr:WecB/TagA/CpsF family glycosyltransferase [Asanoa iriomotensis]GIF55829.1 UDP-N-acetyl-D-mannosaminuronic acid transferase [Asanoa iriomotensis]